MEKSRMISSGDCMRGVHTSLFRALKKGMYPETNTLPKQHTSSLQGEVVDLPLLSKSRKMRNKKNYQLGIRKEELKDFP